MIRTDHQHFLITIASGGRYMRATAETLKGAELARRIMLEDFYDGFKYKKPEAIIIGPLPGPAREN